MNMKDMNIEGKWNGENVITVKNKKKVTVTMGTRPNGTGEVLSENPVVININFPDDRTYIGTLINENQIQWCGLGALRTDNVWTRG